MGDYDGPERRRRRWPSWQSIVALLAVLLAAWATLGVARRNDEIGRLAEENTKRIDEIADLTRRIVVEGRRRRDQSCTQDERRHLDDVNRLRRTYDYLENLPREEWGTNLTAAIVRQLSEVEREARVDAAPDFCDEPHIGLPEPDPELPEPRNFDRLLQRP